MHGLLVQTSQLNKLYLQQVIEMRSANESLSGQLELQRRQQQQEQSKNSLEQQLSKIKETYITQIEQLKETITNQQRNIQDLTAANIKFEKDCLLLKAEKAPIVAKEDNTAARRFIFQKEMLETQIQQLNVQKEVLDNGIQTY